MNYLALAAGAVGLVGIATISLFYTVGGIYGTLNDVCNALLAVLAAALAARLHPVYSANTPGQARLALAAACAGALVAVVGSILVIYSYTGWYLAGLVTTLGYALIGVWVLGFNRATPHSAAWPRPLSRWGRLTGAVMCLGFVALLGLVARVDNPATAPWWAHLGLAPGAGWFLLFPVWCLWLGLQPVRPKTAHHRAQTA